MKVTLTCGSPRGKSSASFYLIEMLKRQLKECKVEELIWNHNSCDDSDLELASKSDAIVFSFPLYVDSIPSHLLRCMVKLDEYMKLHKGKNDVKVYTIVNNGFFDGNQNLIAVDITKNWSKRSGCTFGGAISVGGGGMLLGVKNVPDGKGPAKPIYNAVVEMSDSIKNGNRLGCKVVHPAIPALFYKLAAQHGWRVAAKRNGLKSKDLNRKSL